MGADIEKPAYVDMPTLADVFGADVPLAISTRNGRVEAVHRGTIAVSDPFGVVVAAAGSPDQRTYLRSSAKPFQAMSLVLTGQPGAFGLDSRDLAIVCASHSAEPEHVAAVEVLLRKTGLTPDLLQCGIHPPLNREAALNLVRHGLAPSVLHNNCSGKHAGMLATCAYMDWPLQTYRDPSHPLQQLNVATLAAFAGVPSSQIEVAVDGCGVPAFYIPISAMATAFARLATGTLVDERYAAAASRVRGAMAAHPFLVAGTTRVDTEIMIAGAGTILSKGGAMGSQGVALTEQKYGIAIKVSDGSSHALGVITYAALKGIDALPPDSNSNIHKYERVVLRNHADIDTGMLEPAFVLSEISA